MPLLLSEECANAADKRRQSNAMLYTLITFIGLFVIATTAAVIFYVKSEELRTEKETAEQQRNELANAEEQRMLGTIVGAPLPGQSYLGTMVSHLDRMVRLAKGGRSSRRLLRSR